jgi:hypothetical protein
MITCKPYINMTFAEAKNKAALSLYGVSVFDDLSDSKMRHDALQKAGLLLEQHAASVMEQAFKAGYEWCADTPYWHSLNSHDAFKEYSAKLTAPGR